ncbi:MAG TPA: hypothetical protein ENG83_07165 [Nitrospirae bacterium]|nr:hypothetical protein [Nitrospirota bacterium]HDH49768.1 hypothetical protein [Nitrospirota bacterium]HDK17320.1 hypothetical protein [Nitrospirota bacterium]HDK81258.1 hypothetical protein [Nitrospirota bacterium]
MQKRALHQITFSIKYDFRTDARAQINENPFGWLKFVVDKDTLRILGVHIFTEGASGISGEASLIVSMKAALKDVAGAIHSHPTLTESFGFLAGNMLSTLRRR